MSVWRRRYFERMPHRSAAESEPSSYRSAAATASSWALTYAPR